MLTEKNDRQESLAEHILRLTTAGYTVRITPFNCGEEVEIRLTKDNCTVARLIHLDDYNQSYAWKSYDEWFGYYLMRLEFEYKSYMERWMKEE